MLLENYISLVLVLLHEADAFHNDSSAVSCIWANVVISWFSFLLCPTIAITSKITFSHIQEKYAFFLCESLQTQYFTFSLGRILKSIYIYQISLDGFGLLSGLIFKIFLQSMSLGCQFNYAGRTHLRRVFAWDWLQVETCPSFILYISYVNTSPVLDISWNFLPLRHIPEPCILLITLAFLTLILPSDISREILAYYFLCITVSMYH